jgi:hypothetical protein
MAAGGGGKPPPYDSVTNINNHLPHLSFYIIWKKPDFATGKMKF